jgi:hypothetical protein
MIQPLQKEIIDRLAQICELYPEARFGQMVDFMGFLGQDMFDKPIVHIDDGDFLKVLDRHIRDLQHRNTPVRHQA